MREKRPPNTYGEWVSVAHGKTAESTLVTEAMMSDEKEYWLDAMKQEMNSICGNNVYDLVELPEGKRALNSRWMFKRKIASDGSIECYKACLVAQGSSEKFGMDYDDTFCPIVRFESNSYGDSHSSAEWFKTAPYGCDLSIFKWYPD